MNQQQMFGPALAPLEIALQMTPDDDLTFTTYHDARTWYGPHNGNGVVL